MSALGRISVAARGRAAPLALAVLIVATGVGCGDSPAEAPSMIDEGSWYRSGYHWPHDGHPYESANFVVYSDAASFEARRALAEIGEELLATLKEDFGITSDTLLRFPEGQSKIHMFAYFDHDPAQWGGKGYYGGLIIYSMDHPIRSQYGATDPPAYRAVVEHELVHAIEGLLKGSDDPGLVDVWFTEGIAEHVSGGTQKIPPITTLAQLEELVGIYGQRDPIAMRSYSFPPGPELLPDFYYELFELTLRYLLDPAGAGGTEPAVTEVFLSVRSGTAFADAFEQAFELGVSVLQEEFWPRIREYLAP